MLNYSLMNTPGGTLRGLTAPSSCTVFSYMPLGRDGKKWRFIHQGCWQSLPRPDPEESLSAIWLLGYRTSQKEIQDLYHEVYLLRRSPSPMPCGPQLREEAIQDVLSLLMSQLQSLEGATLQEEDQYGAAAATYQPFSQPEGQSRSRERRRQHDKALQEAREAHQQALEAAHWLELDIERLSQGAGNVQCQYPHGHSGSHWQSKSPDRWEMSPSWCRPERHVTFCEPEVKPFSGGGPHEEPRGHLPQAWMRRGVEGLLPTRRMEVPHPWEIPMAYLDVKNRMGDLSEPSIRNYEVWLNWWAHQLDTLHWWGELVAIPEVEDLKR